MKYRLLRRGQRWLVRTPSFVGFHDELLDWFTQTNINCDRREKNPTYGFNSKTGRFGYNRGFVTDFIFDTKSDAFAFIMRWT